MLIDLSLIHRITDGMVTYPGLPAPVIGTHLSLEAAEELYGPGITFQHLTNLAALPARGFEFAAVPPKIEGTFTVRAFAAT